MNIPVKFKRLHPDAATPQYAQDGDSGFDLTATEDVIVEPGASAIVPTGLAFEIPAGFELQVRPRSGISAKTKLRVANAPGTVDRNFRGEVGVIMDNINAPMYEIEDYGNGPEIEVDVHNALNTIDKSGTVHEGSLLSENTYPVGTYIIRKGDRIAQAVIAPVAHATFTEVDTLDETSRGEGAYGSTGVNTKEDE
jgi:dUTP pyrophosphatase